MPAVLTHVSRTSGHDGYPPTVSKGGNSFVSIGGHPVILVGQEFEPHSDGNNTHTPVLIGGSSFITVNGVPAGLVGDKTDCGDTVVESATAFFTAGG